ncbi:hypothetical protein NL390_32770, partial [Klebsiella pneumoniae]|nr:hypothetical protein [Klebsiella pneumoniae]
MQTTVAQVAAIADAQAKLHVALQDFPLERAYRRDHQYWTGVAEQLKPNMSQDDQALLEQVYQAFNVKTVQYSNRPTGFIHSDLFRD